MNDLPANAGHGFFSGSIPAIYGEKESVHHAMRRFTEAGFQV